MLAYVVVAYRPYFNRTVVTRPQFAQAAPFCGLLFAIDACFQGGVLLCGFQCFRAYVVVSLCGLKVP